MLSGVCCGNNVNGPAPQIMSLFSPLQLRSVTLRNRVVVSPMCQYSAVDGAPTDWHYDHLTKFALGGAGLVFLEATGVEARGRITHGDLGLWNGAQEAALRNLANRLRRHGAVPGIQLAHAGRKASSLRPWDGSKSITADNAGPGEGPWDTIAASAIPLAPGWHSPKAMDEADIQTVTQAFVAAAERAHRAGFDVIELHAAHGYLIHTFLSPLSNRRTDGYGGSLQNRMRFALEVTDAVRRVWPADKPLFVRISAVDWEADGWSLDDSIVLARELKARGVDVIDCSAGGILGPATTAKIPTGPGYQVPFSTRVRAEAGIATQAVGLIRSARQAADIIDTGQADLVALARELLFNPFWALQAARELGETDYATWPEQYGWYLKRRAD